MSASNAAPAAKAGSPHPYPLSEGEGVKSGTDAQKTSAAKKTLFPSRGRGTGFAGPQAQRPPRRAGSYAKRTTVGAFEHGAAILSAMLTVTLVATFAAAALWQQWRSVEVEAAERARVQANWILTGSLDWSRLILREDARSGGADHLAEPWAVPLSEARLSSFLAVDKNASDIEREAFLSGRISDLQARLNVTNLIEGGAVAPAARVQFARLFELLGLPMEELSLMTNGLLEASKSNAEPPAAAAPAVAASGPAGASSAPAAGASEAATPQTGQAGAVTPQQPEGPTALTPLLPQRVEQLIWLGLSPKTLAVLAPHITLLPSRTTVNLNTASAQVISASTPGLDLATAVTIVGTRDRSHFRSLAEASQQIGRADVKFNEAQHSVASRFFEVHGQLRLDQTTIEERSVLQRDGLFVTTIWRERGVSTDFAGSVPRRP
jgi:general secretion pathway protein K